MQLQIITNDELKRITQDVLDEVQTYNNIEVLTSNAPSSALLDKIKYFAIFFIKALQDGDKSALFATLPWMYHAYNAQKIEYGFFLLELDAWEKVIQNYFDTQLTKKTIALLQEIRFNHEKFISMAHSYHSQTKEVPTEYQKQKNDFKNALFSGNLVQSKEIFDSNVSNYKELQDFYEYIIVPSMNDIGIAWENGQITPAQEHLASSIVMETMVLLYTKLNMPSYYKGKVIVGAVANEFHEIGAMMLANSLESDGWDVDYLGANVDDELFLEKITTKSPDIIALSVAMPFNMLHVSELIDKIHTLKLKNTPKIMLGGSALSGNFEQQKLQADSFLHNVDDGVKQANIWYEERL